MQKYKKIAYIALILLIIICVFFIYKVFAKNGQKDNDTIAKSLEDIKLLEGKFLNIFNELNNIKFENYQISANEIKKQNNSSKESSEGQGEGSSSDSKGGSGNSEESSKTEESGGSQTKEDSSKNTEYSLKEQGILTQDTEINWKQIKNDVENLYTPLYNMTLDLYQTNTKQQDIINFNKEYDNLTKAVKNEDKELTLYELSTLYNYLPQFIANCTENTKEVIISKTKDNILKAYSLLEKEQWATIAENINLAAQEFTKLVTDINSNEKTNQYNINKAYIMINEMQNAVLLKDKQIFLIKYKNVIEELENI
ncbi:MAG: hypothetical protein HFJ59_02290 [Clostridia bacterium]|nr:hypothetical protein [Clostridia bacterium]